MRKSLPPPMARRSDPPRDCRCCSGIRTGGACRAQSRRMFFQGAGRSPRGVGGEPQCRQYRLRGREVLHRALHRCRPSCRPSCRRRSTTSRHPKWCWSSSGGSACRRPPMRGSILRALIRRRPRRLSVRPTGRCFSPRPTYCRDWCRGPFTTTMPTMPCACPSGRDAAPS